MSDSVGAKQPSPICVVKIGESLYPTALGRLSDPPRCLYLRGALPNRTMVAIVGTRKAEAAVRRYTENLARDLSRCGLAIVSGGALGVDTAAHCGAVDAGGQTLAVIGSGFDHLYPVANEALFADICAHGGGLLTEYAPPQPPTKWTFPRRNRLVAALASAVVVVQAGERSGALITARLARSLDVPVGAVPGHPADVRNRGNHQLLREGAALVECAEDVVRLAEHSGINRQLNLPDLESHGMKPAGSVRAELSATEAKIVEMLGPRPMHIDAIAAETGFAPGETSATLLALEVAGIVEDQGGKNYIKVG